jgi:hypothetical protein
VALALKMLDGMFEAGNDSVYFGQESFGEEGDSHVEYLIENFRI